MTLENNYVPNKILGNGVTTDFSYTWNALKDEYLDVYLEDVTTNVLTKQILNTDFIFVSGDEAGGIIRFNTAPTTQNYVIIARDVPLNQDTPYSTSKGIDGKELEKSFDKDVAIDQQQTDGIIRSVKVQIGTQNFEGTLPPVVPNRAIIYNSTGTGMATSDFDIQNIGELTQQCLTAEANAQQSATDASNSASSASNSATDAANSAERAKDKFKGDWSNVYPGGYMIGDTVLYNANQWESKIDNNTVTPPEHESTPSSEWLLFLPGNKGADEYVANVEEARASGDGVQTDYNLTVLNPNLKPENSRQVLAVWIDKQPLSELDYSISVQGGNSIITFVTPPPIPLDGDYNILVRGVDPKIIADYDTRITANTNAIALNTVKGEETVLWTGNATTGTVTLSDSMLNYSKIWFMSGVATNIDSTSLNKAFRDYLLADGSRTFTCGNTGNATASERVLIALTGNSEITIQLTEGSKALLQVVGEK